MFRSFAFIWICKYHRLLYGLKKISRHSKTAILLKSIISFHWNLDDTRIVWFQYCDITKIPRYRPALGISKRLFNVLAQSDQLRKAMEFHWLFLFILFNNVIDVCWCMCFLKINCCKFLQRNSSYTIHCKNIMHSRSVETVTGDDFKLIKMLIKML